MDIKYTPTTRKVWSRSGSRGELIPVATVDQKTWAKISREMLKDMLSSGGNRTIGVRVKYNGYYLMPEKPI